MQEMYPKSAFGYMKRIFKRFWAWFFGRRQQQDQPAEISPSKDIREQMAAIDEGFREGLRAEVRRWVYRDACIREIGLPDNGSRLIAHMAASPTELHCMKYARKARTRKKYRNRIVRRVRKARNKWIRRMNRKADK